MMLARRLAEPGQVEAAALEVVRGIAGESYRAWGWRCWPPARLSRVRWRRRLELVRGIADDFDRRAWCWRCWPSAWRSRVRWRRALELVQRIAHKGLRGWVLGALGQVEAALELAAGIEGEKADPRMLELLAPHLRKPGGATLTESGTGN